MQCPACENEPMIVAVAALINLLELSALRLDNSCRSQNRELNQRLGDFLLHAPDSGSACPQRILVVAVILGSS
jgi:hypothetical protein